MALEALAPTTGEWSQSMPLDGYLCKTAYASHSPEPSGAFSLHRPPGAVREGRQPCLTRAGQRQVLALGELARAWSTGDF
jgi:hypothetical protein